MSKDFVIFGRNPVKEALRSKRVLSLYISDSFTDSTILSLAKDNKLSPVKVSNQELDKKCEGGVHQGVMAVIKPYEYLDFNELLRRGKNKKVPIIVILDGINDPHNFGAIMRSCDVFDVTGIVVGKHNQVPLNSTVAKTSAGAINFVPVAVVNNLNNTIAKLKENGYWIVSTDGSASIDYSDINYDFPVGLVIGSEGQGVSKLVLKNSDYVVKIPQYGHVNSLNASVAAGIMLARIRN